MFEDVKVGFLSARSSIKRGNKKTTFFIIFVLSLIFINLVFLPSLINGMMGLFVGFVKDYAYGDVVIEPAENENFISHADNLLMKVRSVNGVGSAAKRLQTAASISYDENVVGVTIQGLVPSDEEEVSLYPFIVSEGDFLGDRSRDEILIGAMIAGKGTGSEIYDNLGEVDAGAFVNVTYTNNFEKTYKVRGIHEGTFELTDLNAIVHYKELEDILGISGENKASTIVIRTEEDVDVDVVKKKILGLGVKEKVFTWEEKAEVLIKQAMQSIGALNIMSKIISLIVGASLIFIVIYINILNRKREIGILKAIGISKLSIIFSYIFISLFYVVSGIILGLTIFLSLTFYLQSHPLMFYESLKVSPIFDFWLVAENVLIMIGMSIVAGFLPSWAVSRQDILNAIWGR